MIKVIFTGTESTGKTTLCRQISKYYNYPFIKEYSRDYLLKIDRKYNKKDLVEIAKKQIEFEKSIEFGLKFNEKSLKILIFQ